MSGNLAEWIVVGAFFFIVSALLFAEAFWLYKKGWASFGKSFVFSALSNFIGFGVGLFVFFVVMGLFLMFSLDGTTQRIFDSRAGGAAAITVLIVASLLTPFLLIICKRVLLGALKIQSGKAAWLYALASSVLILIVSLGVPFLIGYLLYR
jgi:hypothetical protein